jgi:signal transduction histidine kinase
MENTPKVYRIQRRIGLAFAAAFGLLIVLQLLRIAVIRTFPEHAHLVSAEHTGDDYLMKMALYILSYVVLGGVFLLSALRNRPFWCYFQVGVFLLLGFTLLVVSPLGDLTGPMFVVTGIILGAQYGFLRTHITAKLAVTITAAVIARVVGVFLLPKVGLFEVLFTLLAILLFVHVYYSLFSEQIAEQRAREQIIRRRLKESEQYSQLGRNVSAILHNLKNVYFALNHGLEMLQNRSDEELRTIKVDRMELISSLRSATENFSEKIENIVEYTGSSQRVDRERIALLWHAARLVDIFCLDKSFKEQVDVQLNIPRDLEVTAPPIKLNQVLENLLMNSWEAIREYRVRGGVHMSGFTNEAGEVVLRVEDNGGGIPDYETSGYNGKSLTAGEYFVVGKTSKPGGSGHGVPYVIETMRELGGDVVISSREGEGTAVELRFPPCGEMDETKCRR